MSDVFFFLIFAWILSAINTDEMVLELLESVFNREFSVLYYYGLFALIGIGSRVFFYFQNVWHRD